MPDKSSKGRTGVVLAAGLGSRLQGASDETLLKPLTPVGGRPLILRTIDSLSKAGCSSVVVVVGHGAADIESTV
ncbi:MAG TPA: NTP transferase domain-containing protein, partial [Rhodothermia bacterium]|nr:NTP transferase domain-containing protein [Rhodothermia bacterium]